MSMSASRVYSQADQLTPSASPLNKIYSSVLVEASGTVTLHLLDGSKIGISVINAPAVLPIRNRGVTDDGTPPATIGLR